MTTPSQWINEHAPDFAAAIAREWHKGDRLDNVLPFDVSGSGPGTADLLTEECELVGWTIVGGAGASTVILRDGGAAGQVVGAVALSAGAPSTYSLAPQGVRIRSKLSVVITGGSLGPGVLFVRPRNSYRMG